LIPLAVLTEAGLRRTGSNHARSTNQHTWKKAKEALGCQGRRETGSLPARWVFWYNTLIDEQTSNHVTGPSLLRYPETWRIEPLFHFWLCSWGHDSTWFKVGARASAIQALTGGDHCCVVLSCVRRHSVLVCSMSSHRTCGVDCRVRPDIQKHFRSCQHMHDQQ